MTSYQVINNKNEYSCGDISISTKEWYDLLNMPKAKEYLSCRTNYVLGNEGHYELRN